MPTVLDYRPAMSAFHTLLSAHFSALYNTSRIQHVPVPTTQSDLPFLAQDEEGKLFSEHASYASYYNSPQQPSILLRLVNSYSLQLSSVSGHVPPIVFDFPSPILPNPQIVADQFSEAHVIVCTESGSVYRICLPVPTLWTTLPIGMPHKWLMEHVVQSPTKENLVSAHVADPSLVAIALKDGRILRLQATRRHGDSRYGPWSETLLHPSTTLLSGWFSGSRPGANDVLGFGSDASHASAELIVSLSRDRQVRVWKDKLVAAVQLGDYLDAEGVMLSSRNPPLLPESTGTVVRVLPPKDADLDEDPDANSRVVVFIAALPGAKTAGFFVVHEITGRTNTGRSIIPKFTLDCSPQTAARDLRDFVVIDDVVWCLWDMHGTCAVEYCSLLDDSSDWKSVVPPTEPDLNPEYFNDLLQRKGSIADTFMSVVLNPGVFSRYTLETALHEYRGALSAFLDQQSNVLLESYPTISEHIIALVGSTVDLGSDPKTGEKLYDQYWEALKRDWEGFIARCVEIERSARWPIALGIGEDEQIMVLQRERLGIVAIDDVPMRVHKMALEQSLLTQSPAPELLHSAMQLRAHIPPPARALLETRITEASREVLAFSCWEVAADISEKFLLPNLPNSINSWFTAWVGSRGGQVQVGLEGALEILLNVEAEIKAEAMDEDDGYERGSSTTLALRNADNWDQAQWPKAFTTAYLDATIEARAELCMTLLIACLFIVQMVPEALNDSSIIDRAFAAYQSMSILQHLSRQPADHPDAEHAPAPGADDILTKMQNMRMASAQPEWTKPKINYSLLHTLLSAPVGTVQPRFTPLEDAHRFLRENQLVLGGAFPLEAEVRLLDNLRARGHLDLAREIGQWLPLAPGVAFVLARTALAAGRPEEAAELFERVARSFDDDDLANDEDADALYAVLPFENPRLSVYYQAVMEFFAELSLEAYVVQFGKLAIESSSPHEEPHDLWEVVFKATVALGYYEEAYSTILAGPQKLREGFIRHLIGVMCDRAEIDRLTRLNFVGYQADVENTLSFKARNSDPIGWPNYSKVLYSWHVFRGDYRSAGEAMFKQARRLNEIQCRPEEYIDFATEEAQCYLAAINCLSLVDPKSAWVAMPASNINRKLTRRQPKAPSVIPAEMFGEEALNDVEIIELADMRQEYMLVMSRLSLAQRYPQHDLANLVISPTNIVSRWLQGGDYDEALSNARSLNVSMSAIFENLASKCVFLSKSGNITEDAAPWLMTDRAQSWGGSLAQRAWRYLQESLERYDTADNDFQYRKVVLSKILDEDRSSRLPNWLMQFFEEKLPEHLVRTCLRYNLLADALRHSTRIVNEVRNRPRRRPAEDVFGSANSAALPFGLFDQLLVAVKDSNDKSLKPLETQLRTELSGWKQNAHKYTEDLRRRT